MSQAIDISDLPEPLVETIKAMIRDYREGHSMTMEGCRELGWAKGILPELPESFFEPLPGDVLDFFEGKVA